MSDPKFENIGTPQDKVIEEIGEVLKAIGKVRRFGLENFHPDRPDSTNKKELEEELHDLMDACQKYLKELYYHGNWKTVNKPNQ